MINVDRVPMKRVKFDRLALRRAAYAALVVLCAVAVYRAVVPPKQVIVERPVAGAPDLPAQSFAREFTAAYLTFDSERPELRAAALEQFAGGKSENWGYAAPTSGARTVRETIVEQVYPHADDQATYVISARTTSGQIHLSVNVGRVNGALQVVGFPAIVGGPARTGAAEASTQDMDEVKDAELETVVERALKNWFAHQTSDLEADLSPSAEISLPDQTYELRQLAELEDARDGSVRATVVVLASDGEQLTLTYDLNVEKRADRWTISAIQTLPDWH